MCSITGTSTRSNGRTILARICLILMSLCPRSPPVAIVSNQLHCIVVDLLLVKSISRCSSRSLVDCCLGYHWVAPATSKVRFRRGVCTMYSNSKKKKKTRTFVASSIHRIPHSFRLRTPLRCIHASRNGQRLDLPHQFANVQFTIVSTLEQTRP